MRKNPFGGCGIKIVNGLEGEMAGSLEEFARAGGVVVFAGAGVSAGRPSALPGWRQLNEEIVSALRKRLEKAVDRKRWLADVVTRVGGQRDAGRFPPDYQAQIIEEMCGDRYFRALQALDVDVINSGHEAIAALAAGGALRAVVTTNFDRLTERALEQRGVAYDAVFDDAGFVRMGARLGARLGAKKPAEMAGPLPVIKIHGCVSDHRSMIDTLKQRKRGRSSALQSCLNPLFGGYWLYVGFSAADLETDRKYLGLIAGARRSAGATYVSYPGHPELGAGARALMAAYRDRGRVVTAQIADELGRLCRELGLTARVVPDEKAAGPKLVAARLAKWAEGLSVSATGLCLAAILEAAGEAEAGVRVLDQLVRKEVDDERESADFRALQLHYGRLGASYGRFVAIPDLGGAASNASVETGQSLARVQDSEYGFAARCWLGCYFLWMNMGEEAMGTAVEILQGLTENNWGKIAPRSDEEAVDAWLVAASIFIVNTHWKTAAMVQKTFPAAMEQARRSGDVVRTARVAALYLLACAEAVANVPEIVREWEKVFNDARRVGDGYALGFRALALGRWHVGGGALEQAKTRRKRHAVAKRAMGHLNEAARLFDQQGMHPWEVYTNVQQTKALMDLERYNDLNPAVNAVADELNRFPILASHLYEAIWQMERAFGNAEAKKTYRRAVQYAADSGLEWRKKFLKEQGEN
jgi:hypothetical protein